MTYVNILDHGATTDGALCTAAIQKAIDVCATTGGVVEVPAGTFMTGTIELRSGISLSLAKGAVLKGSPDMADYRDIGVMHDEWGSVRTLIYAIDAHDVTIEGSGRIDFNGSSFFDFDLPHHRELDTVTMTAAQRQEFDVRTEARPNQLIFLQRCERITVRDIELIDAPCWGLCVISCDTVRISDLRIRYSKRIPNSDGIHLVSCQNVIISGCDIVSGDDCIAITGVTDWTRESRNILITGCLLSSSSAGIRVGYWHSRVRDVRISNCIIDDSVRGITVMACGSGYVEDVSVTDVSIRTRALAGSWWGMGEGIYVSTQHHDVERYDAAVMDRQPRTVNVRDLTFRNLTMHVEFGIVLVADRPNAEDLRFIDINITLHNSQNRDYFGDALDLNPGSLARDVPSDAAYWLYAEQIRSLRVCDVSVRSTLQGRVWRAASELRNCDGVTIWPEAPVIARTDSDSGSRSDD